MAHRVGSGRKKGKGRSKKKTHRAGGGRKAQGRKLARFNELRKQGHSKAEARAMAFGSGGGKKKGRKSGGKRRATSHRSGGWGLYGRLLRAALNDVQRGNGTTGFQPTVGEKRQAEQIAHFELQQMGGVSHDPEAARRAAFQERLKREKRQEAERRIQALMAERAKAEREEARRKAEKDIEAEAARL